MSIIGGVIGFTE
jgi:hypothetical protein